jgi:tetratricopeptide (TPR) repeat protein
MKFRRFLPCLFLLCVLPAAFAQDAKFYFNRGIEYHKAGDINRAIADYTQAIALNPQHEYAYNNRGSAYYTKGELDRAIADFTQAIAINPVFDGAYTNRGIVYYDKGELDRAIADSTRAIAINSWNDLPGTEIEAHAIGKIAAKSTVILGRDASEATVKELSATGGLERFPVLHFACHGYFNGARPELSSIVFSEVSGLLPESPEDGYLTMAEAALLKLNARTVILSACNTGKGGLKRGDGMVGLVRSLLVAGGRSAGVSLWPISDDAAVEFMEGVYRRALQEGKSFREAYYEVKQMFRRSAYWNHPFYHAAFVLYE